MNTPHHGSCLCGGVAYELASAPRAVTHCHCSQCRKAHGAAFATYASVPRADHAFTRGQALVRSHRSSPAVTRSFCGACGSPLLWRRDAGEFAEWVSFPLATLDTPFVPTKQRHAHAGSTAAWHTITDDWPQT